MGVGTVRSRDGGAMRAVQNNLNLHLQGLHSWDTSDVPR